MPTIQKFIQTSFENKLLDFHKSGIQLNRGDAILAKMRGFDPWPAKLVDFNGNKKTIKCFFYGTQNTGTIGVKHIIPFSDSFDTVRLILLKNRSDFQKGIKEIEIEYGIPEELSAARDFGAIK